MKFELNPARILESGNTRFSTLAVGAGLLILAGYELKDGNYVEAMVSAGIAIPTLGIGAAGPDIAKTIRNDVEAGSQSTPENNQTTGVKCSKIETVTQMLEQEQ